jgi:hypothetical protein
MQVKILSNTRGTPAHKLADVELVFDDAEGPLAGLKLVGVAIWSTREQREVSVTFPARTYQGDGVVRYYNFLRPETDKTAMDRLKAYIKERYEQELVAAA